MKQKKELNVIVNTMILVLIEVFTFRLFFCQANRPDGLFRSDLTAHIRNALNDGVYSLVASLIRGGYRLVDSNAGVALVLSLVVVFTVLCLNFVMKKYLDGIGEAGSRMNTLPIAASCIFLAALYIPGQHIYKGSYLTQPWHNSTYIVMRLFAIMTMYFYFTIEKEYLEHIDIKKALLFTATLALSTYAKPNFLIAFAPMMLVFLIRDFVRSGGRSFKQAVLFGICVFPSLAVLLFQKLVLFPTGGKSGIALTAKNLVSFFTTGKFIIVQFTNYAFCLFTLFYFVKTKNVSRTVKYSWVMLLIGWFESRILTETGYRAKHGNFSWGNHLFALIVIYYSLLEWISLRKKNAISARVYYIGIALYLVNVVMGIGYFVYLQFGNYYYV